MTTLEYFERQLVTIEKNIIQAEKRGDGVAVKNLMEKKGHCEEAVRALQTSNRRADRWHKWPDEKPPEEDMEYLVTYEGTDVVYTDCYRKGVWETESMPDALKVLAWCKLPEPWEKE